MRSPRRMMCATVLALQAIVLGLVTPVLISVRGVSTAAGLSIGLGLAVIALLIAGSLRTEAAYYAGFALQVAALATGILVPVMIVLGLAFGALWTAAYLLGRKIEVERAAWTAAAEAAGGVDGTGADGAGADGAGADGASAARDA
jgi:hypothetical protein